MDEYPRIDNFRGFITSSTSYYQFTLLSCCFTDLWATGTLLSGRVCSICLILMIRERRGQPLWVEQWHQIVKIGDVLWCFVELTQDAWCRSSIDDTILLLCVLIVTSEASLVSSVQSGTHLQYCGQLCSIPWPQCNVLPKLCTYIYDICFWSCATLIISQFSPM